MTKTDMHANLQDYESQRLNFLKVLLVVYAWTVVFLLTIFFASMILLVSPFAGLLDRQKNTLHGLAILWAKSIVYFNPWWSFRTEGTENLPKDLRPVVYVANHQSQADIISVFLLSKQFRWLAKQSLFSVPIFGWAMLAAGYVPVRRGDRRSHIECMRLARKHLDCGTSMLFFPEGTRSRDGRLQDFKAGAFRLAREAGVDIIPLTLQGASDLLPKGSIVPARAAVRITVHTPIPTAGRTESELMSDAKAAIASALES